MPPELVQTIHERARRLGLTRIVRVLCRNERDAICIREFFRRQVSRFVGGRDFTRFTFFCSARLSLPRDSPLVPAPARGLSPFVNGGVVAHERPTRRPRAGVGRRRAVRTEYQNRAQIEAGSTTLSLYLCPEQKMALLPRPAPDFFFFFDFDLVPRSELRICGGSSPASLSAFRCTLHAAHYRVRPPSQAQVGGAVGVGASVCILCVGGAEKGAYFLGGWCHSLQPWRHRSRSSTRRARRAALWRTLNTSGAIEVACPQLREFWVPWRKGSNSFVRCASP